jgi:C1A family cysteine protease
MARLILGPHLLGAIPSPVDDRDYKLADHLDTAAPLPSTFRLKLLAPPLNQGNTGRCVAFSGTGLRQQQERSNGDWPKGWPPLDAEWLYEHAEAIDGIPTPPGPQRGTTIRAALQVLAKQGQPLTGKLATAGNFRIASYWAVQFTEDAIKRALVQYGGVYVALRWDQSFFHPLAGVIPAPSGQIVGGHVVWLFGYDDTVAGGSALLRNSWGASWGVRGNAYIPWRYLTPLLHDAWSLADIRGDAP